LIGSSRLLTGLLTTKGTTILNKNIKLTEYPTAAGFSLFRLNRFIELMQDLAWIACCIDLGVQDEFNPGRGLVVVQLIRVGPEASEAFF